MRSGKDHPQLWPVFGYRAPDAPSDEPPLAGARSGRGAAASRSGRVADAMAAITMNAMHAQMISPTR
ncbi:hypothetical protein ACFOSC_15460 [Streptantibioticus rubrisoli]|uniref:Uncharacterized protein n=1 Tax=Streptantibioticus rubrisoli TaxID=1387313 RepID=A0ABT1PFJ7_9ACTN|nr:hypothetical protein [Streptantibioticus rubrisoli]MCQ4044134.1 hypothetical protein [Streptantibioticus rubrisoli]